jgi:catechol 2,3-dioxygenase-like lactoylglutathione lyase family enzyme
VLVTASIAIGTQPALVQSARPQIIGIAYVVFQTSDLAKARSFYGDLLGYPEVAPGGRQHVAVFAVNDRQRLIVHDGLPPDRDERLLALAFETTSVDAMRTFLKDHASPISEATTDSDADAGGKQIEVTDPDGHRVRFIERDQRPVRQSQTRTDRRISRRILHAGLSIRDVSAADAFYKDALGFSEIWRGGRTPDVTSWINMRVPDATEYLEYMLVTADRVDRRELGTLHHVALLVPDMQEALQIVRSRTVSGDPNHRATPQVGRNNRWQLNLYDPDGTRIEFMEPWTLR